MRRTVLIIRKTQKERFYRQLRKKGAKGDMEERRRIDRVGYQAKSVIVVCDSGESIFVETCNVSPLGIAFTMPAGSPDLKGKDIIIVADTMIMYADVTRQEEQEDGDFKVAISAKKFTPEVLQYLFEHIVEK